MKVLLADAMRAVDRRAIEEIGIPSLVLMENAALGVVDALVARFPEARSVAIFCGPGNNGGDGLAVARQLAQRGFELHLYLLAGGRALSEDAAVQLAICRRGRLEVVEVEAAAELERALTEAERCDLLVDALFGTGLTRGLEGLFAACVVGLNTLGRPILAVDLPSGLDASRHQPPGPHIEADLTVTFAAPKLGHVLDPAARAVGELAVADLGIPGFLLDEADSDLEWLEAEEVASLLPRRPADSHKGSCGHVLLVVGGPGRAGAAILAAQAAVRGGAGLVTAAVPAPLLPLVDGGSLESLTLALPAGADGELSAEAAAVVLEAAKGKTSLAVGPGLGRTEGAQETIRNLVRHCPLPLVLDADGLNAFAGRLEVLREQPAPTVLTPHPGEMGRLLGLSTAQVQADRLAAVRRAAALSGAVVVLKGHQSLIAGPETTWINPTGNPGMASGGSGDVLTGTIAALLAQGLEAAEAARVAVYLHGLAGDRAAARLGEVGLTASDLVAELPAARHALLTA